MHGWCRWSWCIGVSVFLFICLYSYTPVSDESLSTATTVAITAVISSLVAFIAGTVCGVLLTVCISRWNKKRDGFKPAPNIEEQPQAVPMVDRKNQEMIELEENVAYGPVKHDQMIELEEASETWPEDWTERECGGSLTSSFKQRLLAIAPFHTALHARSHAYTRILCWL